jgi:hypothetical protein
MLITSSPVLNYPPPLRKINLAERTRFQASHWDQFFYFFLLGSC